jgi:MFS transporter, AAHS family, 4-hydroxybenzoate transporter
MSTPATRIANVINVTELVDNAPFSALHWRAFALCMACLVMDGFDVQVLGYTAPSIIREWA